MFKRVAMFYPIPSINEIMPDILIDEIDVKICSPYKNRIAYFTRDGKEYTDISFERRMHKSFKFIPIEKTFEATKGVLPTDIMIHPFVQYNYRGEHILLNGLDNSTKSGLVNNGSWRP
jgi:hypothetical protein